MTAAKGAIHSPAELSRSPSSRVLEEQIDRLTAKDVEAGAAFAPVAFHLPRWAESKWSEAARRAIGHNQEQAGRFARLEWQKLGERNEGCTAARDAVRIAGADR